jgi:superoxide dismutase, Fe-Mn family
MSEITRREFLAGAASTAAVALGPHTGAKAMDTGSSFRGSHQPKALPFDATKLDGLSERLIQSHWENNYGGSVKALNMVEQRLAGAIAEPDFPPLIYGGLKREEAHRVGSVVLHERYFGNLGGDGKPVGDIAAALRERFGSLETWESDFRRTALALGGGSGWVVTSLNLHTNELRTQWSWDHMTNMPAGVPLLVLDMYEHAYHMDYGAAASKYVDAFMRNVAWSEVDRRFLQARRMFA